MFMGDTTTVAVEHAIRGLAARADVRAHNVANANTPGFRAQEVDFESALRAAVRAGRADRAPAPAVGIAPNTPDAYGNTVDLESDLIGMMRDNLLRGAMVNAHNFKTSVLRTAIKGH